jgi:MFS family permease
MSKDFLFNCVLAAAAASLITTPLFGYLSDLIGRKRMYITGAVTMMLFAFPYYMMIDTAVPTIVFLAVILSLPVHDMQYGPQAAFIAESFPADVRYSGSSLGYQLASITSGGPAPLIATWLLHDFGTSAAVSAYLVFIAGISVISALLLPDRSARNYMAASDQLQEKAVPEIAPVMSVAKS